MREIPQLPDMGGQFVLGRRIERTFTTLPTEFGNRFTVRVEQPTTSANQGIVSVRVFVPEGDLRE